MFLKLRIDETSSRKIIRIWSVDERYLNVYVGKETTRRMHRYTYLCRVHVSLISLIQIHFLTLIITLVKEVFFGQNYYFIIIAFRFFFAPTYETPPDHSKSLKLKIRSLNQLSAKLFWAISFEEGTSLSLFPSPYKWWPQERGMMKKMWQVGAMVEKTKLPNHPWTLVQYQSNPPLSRNNR